MVPFNLNKKTAEHMEALVLAMIATRNGYTHHAMFVPEPTKFPPFDLRALRHFYSAEDKSPGRPSDRKKLKFRRSNSLFVQYMLF